MNNIERIIGIKIYDYEKGFPELFANWRPLGINAAFVSVSLASQQAFRDLAKKNDIKTFIIVPIFYNPEVLKTNPALYAITGNGLNAHQDWVSFICPTRKDYRQQRIEYVKTLIKEIKPDGVSLDFIRHFVYWEKVAPGSTIDLMSSSCFDSACLERFQQEAKLSIPESLLAIHHKAEWILANCSQEWSKWKCRVITMMVRDISEAARSVKQNCLINVHAVPWRKKDFEGAITKVAGQDFAEISRYADYISPMCYSHMLRREPTWINSVVYDLHQQSLSQIIPAIQVKEYYRDEALSIGEFTNCLREALRPPSYGVVFWEWEMLDQDPQKKDVVRTLI